MASTTAASYPNMMNNFNASPVYSHQQQQCQPQQQSRALVPATAPGRTVYSNYVVPTTTTTINNTNDDDLIDLGVGDNMSAGYGTTYSQQSTSNQTANNATDNDDDDLISFDNNNVSFATPPPSTSASTVAASNTNAVEVRDLRALQDRDDEFVKNLPKELIEEQERILSQIQKRNNNRSNGNNQLVSWNSTGQERFEQKLMDSLPEEESSSCGIPAEVHPKKYQMKTERKVKTAASATAGMVVGGLILAPVFPIGMAAGAAVGGYTAKVISRSGERKQQRKWDQKNFNDYTAQGNCDVQSDNVVFA